MVAVILAVGMCTAINIFCVGVLVDALYSDDPGLSENATQILTGWGGGIIGVIGALVGYKSGENRMRDEEDAAEDAVARATFKAEGPTEEPFRS
jgi:hypothetical protein